MSRLAVPLIAIALLAGVAGCNRKPAESVEALDKELVGRATGPVSSGALGSQIVVDPAVARKSMAAVPPSPAAGPATIPGEKCAFAYDAGWARKLPAELPVYPGGKVTEAAGSDAPGCRRRIVSFTAAAPVADVLDFYRGRITRAGYSAEHQVQPGGDVLGGTRGDAAYYINVAPSGAGVTVDLVSNEG